MFPVQGGGKSQLFVACFGLNVHWRHVTLSLSGELWTEHTNAHQLLIVLGAHSQFLIHPEGAFWPSAPVEVNHSSWIYSTLTILNDSLTVLNESLHSNDWQRKSPLNRSWHSCSRSFTFSVTFYFCFLVSKSLFVSFFWYKCYWGEEFSPDLQNNNNKTVSPQGPFSSCSGAFSHITWSSSDLSVVRDEIQVFSL